MNAHILLFFNALSYEIILILPIQIQEYTFFGFETLVYCICIFFFHAQNTGSQRKQGMIEYLIIIHWLYPTVLEVPKFTSHLVAH